MMALVFHGLHEVGKHMFSWFMRSWMIGPNFPDLLHSFSDNSYSVKSDQFENWP